jgi:hypothetical protein
MTLSGQTPLRVLFVCANDFHEASAKQALWFARELRARGHRVMMSITGNADAPAARFRPDVIHCLSARLASVAVASHEASVTGAPVVHWADDEWRISDDPMGCSRCRRMMRPLKRLGAHGRGCGLPA